MQWQTFAPGYLEINMNDVTSLMPFNNVNITTTAMGILRTWRNINRGTIKMLRDIIDTMVKDKVLDKNVQTEYQKMLGMGYIKHIQNKLYTTRHY